MYAEIKKKKHVTEYIELYIEFEQLHCLKNDNAYVKKIIIT